jgi:hypothetical protein
MTRSQGAAAETYVTQHVTRGRLARLELMLGERLEKALHLCTDERTSAKYLDALCIAHFGPIQPKSPRSDRGGWHRLPDAVWSLTCKHCGAGFHASRLDRQFCHNGCRQAAYRQRKTEADS